MKMAIIFNYKADKFYSFLIIKSFDMINLQIWIAGRT